jgi:hypothetical protein
MKKTLLPILILAVTLTGCGPIPTPAEPTADIQVVVGTMMAATLTAIAPTPVPPTETPAPEPTATEVPPGTLMENFDENFIIPGADGSEWYPPYDAADPTGLVKHDYKVSLDQGFLRYDFNVSDTYLYTFPKKEMPADVSVETTYVMNSNQNSEASVVCRVDPATRLKWYEFRIIHFERYGVIYYFERVDVYHNPYSYRLAYVPLPVELFKDKPNRLEAVCKGNKLSMFLNGGLVASVEDSKIPGGGLVGLGGVSHYKVPMTMTFDYLQVKPPE